MKSERPRMLMHAWGLASVRSRRSLAVQNRASTGCTCAAQAAAWRRHNLQRCAVCAARAARSPAGSMTCPFQRRTVSPASVQRARAYFSSLPGGGQSSLCKGHPGCVCTQLVPPARGLSAGDGQPDCSLGQRRSPMLAAHRTPWGRLAWRTGRTATGSRSCGPPRLWHVKKTEVLFVCMCVCVCERERVLNFCVRDAKHARRAWAEPSWEPGFPGLPWWHLVRTGTTVTCCWPETRPTAGDKALQL